METPTNTTPENARTPGDGEPVQPDAIEQGQPVATADVSSDAEPEPSRKTLATLTDPDREGELSLVERLYVDHAAGRVTTDDAMRRLLAFASGCDDDAYADENPED